VNKLAANLLFLRKQKKLTQAEMPENIGINRSTWANYEAGKTEPALDDVIRIASFFDVTVTDLLTKDLEEEGKPLELSENMEKGKPNGKGIGKLMGENVPVFAEDQAEYAGQEWNNKQLTKAVFQIKQDLAVILKKLDS
jgi:transcriptional regulator with XRE-family HTH domain